MAMIRIVVRFVEDPKLRFVTVLCYLYEADSARNIIELAPVSWTSTRYFEQLIALHKSSPSRGCRGKYGKQNRPLHGSGLHSSGNFPRFCVDCTRTTHVCRW